ncbi:MAG: cysteine hydrolase [Ruminococcaceae bacterium]|nr:cysteine hydrolase [Oscillospiraceae bacterium]
MRKVLIVVDMQNDFIDGALGTKEAELIVDNCVEKINNFKGDIIVTYDTHFENYLDTQEGRNLPFAHCIKGTRGWELNSKIQNALNGKNYDVIEKTTFGSKDLPQFLKDNFNTDNIEVEFIGICTDICVVSNALLLKAFYPELKISAYKSCMAGVTPSKHEAAIEVLKSCQINIL